MPLARRSDDNVAISKGLRGVDLNPGEKVKIRHLTHQRGGPKADGCEYKRKFKVHLSLGLVIQNSEKKLPHLRIYIKKNKIK